MSSIESATKYRAAESMMKLKRSKERVLSHSRRHLSSTAEVDDNDCIHGLFEQQVGRTPNAIAIVSPQGTLTYAALNARVDALAFELRRHGVLPETLVGIHLEKSAEWIIGILAILKAGGAYVPMDPINPVDRIAEAPLRLVLTKEHSASLLATFKCPLMHVDRILTRPLPQGQTAMESPAKAANLAYVIYTSGSTGKPKGVAVEHRSLVYSTRARYSQYRVPTAFLLISATACDSAVAGIFDTLTRGGTLHLPTAGTEADVLAISRLIRRDQIDTILMLPSLYQLLLEAAAPHTLSSLRTVIVAGERCHPPLVAASRAKVPGVELYNEYGPTEGTVWCTVWKAPAADAPELHTVPIGKPIPGVRITIINTIGEPVKHGEVGELCISGAGVARGYYDEPGLTAQSFRPDPHGPPGTRRYHTGDLVRQRADGQLELLGRIDRQLKIQGYRVEPGEVEDALTFHPKVRQAAVVADRRSSVVRLAAFVIADGTDPSELQQFLCGRLPAYMVPTSIRLIDAFPLMASGKVNLGKLEQELKSDALSQSHDKFCTATEEVTADVWREVLDLTQIGRSRPFFDVGSSLDAVRISLRLSQAFDREVPLLWIYEAPTIERLADWLTRNIDEAEATAREWLIKRGHVGTTAVTPR